MTVVSSAVAAVEVDKLGAAVGDGGGIAEGGAGELTSSSKRRPARRN